MKKLFLLLFVVFCMLFTGISFADQKVVGIDGFHESPRLEKAIGQMQNYTILTLGSEVSGTMSAETGYAHYYMPYDFKCVGLMAWVREAPTADMVIDINLWNQTTGAGSTIFDSYINGAGSTVSATKLYIQSGSENSLGMYEAGNATSGSEYYMTTTSFSRGDELVVDIDATTAGGPPNIYMYGRITSIPSKY